MELDYAAARRLLLEEAAKLDGGASAPAPWVALFEKLSLDCEEVNIRTHVAFVATAILARATSDDVDVYAVKAKAGGRGAYSARGLVKVWVEEAHSLGVHLGATGREPLNNQPYFRIDRATKEALLDAAKPSSRRPIKTVLTILKSLENAKPAQARGALRAFIAVRRTHRPAYAALGQDSHLKVQEFVQMVSDFVFAKSEGGRRAQAVAGGMMDVVFGAGQVRIERINAPDRHLPGDVGLMSQDGAACWKVLEVRDKPVLASDVLRSVEKAARARTPVVGILCVSKQQKALDAVALANSALEMGVEVELFVGWERFIKTALFWAPSPLEEAMASAVRAIHERLKQVEASATGVAAWSSHAGS